MKIREVLVGILVVIVIVALAVFLRNRRTSKNPSVPTSTPSVEQKLESGFNLTIPGNVDKVELKKVAEVEGSGIATRNYKAGKFTLTILADLPDLEKGVYQAWLENSSGQKVALGNLEIAKGGFLLNFSASKDYSPFNKVVVALASKPILQGSF